MTFFHPRAEWGARAPRYRYLADMSAKSTGHWNGPQVRVGGKTTWDHSICASLVRGIQNFHMDGRNWSDIAYNFVVCPHNHVYEGRGLNVINGANGTNTGNRTSHAVMWLSGEGNPFTDGEKLGFRYIVRVIADRTNAPASPAIGHRDHKSTACPGDERYNWIHAGMKVPGTTTVKKEDIVFKDGDDARNVVNTAYQYIVGREVESDEVRETWAYTLAVQGGRAYVNLELGLLYERQKHENAKFKKMAAQVSEALEQGTPVPTTVELTDAEFDQLKAEVYAELADRIDPDDT